MATFAVNETARREQYVSTGQATYNFNFQVNAASELQVYVNDNLQTCLLYTSPSPRDAHESRMPSSA